MGVSAKGRRLGGDIESNGLLRAKGGIPPMDRVHCVGYQDIDTGEEFYFGPAVPYEHPMWEHNGASEEERRLLASPCGTVEDGIRFLCEADMSVFHNGANFDYRAIKKFYPWAELPKDAWDSFLMASIVWPAEVILGPDLIRARQGKFPMQLLKSHSLKAWGYRVGDPKDEYIGDFDKYPEDGTEETKKVRYDERWREWNPYMASYMMQDNRPMVKLWKLIEKKIGWTEPEKADVVWPKFVLEYEHEYAMILAEQEDFGVRFDIPKAHAMEVELLNIKATINSKLEDVFGSWWSPGKETTPGADRNVKRTDLPDVTTPRFGKNGKELAPYVGPPLERYSVDAPYTPITRITYSATNRDHLGLRLQDVYGWKPKAYGKSGKPTVDEGTLEEIPDSVMPTDLIEVTPDHKVPLKQLILDGFVVAKLIAMLANWLRSVDEDSRIHGRVNPNGTITRRCSHSSPNLGQTPAVLMEKLVGPDGKTFEQIIHGLRGKYGHECRELFTADEGWELTGTDATGLELIVLGHYLFPHDEGAFSARVCDPNRDPHQEHATMASEAGGMLVTRKDAKTTIYLKVFGGSAFKLSLDKAIVVKEDEVPELLKYKGLPMLLRSLVKRFDQDFVDTLDDMQKARIVKARRIIMALEAGIPGLDELTKAITEAGEKGWIKGLDGSRLTVRKAYSTLNTALQSGGSMLCKVWKVLFDRKMRALGYVRGLDYKQVLDVHDEHQVTHRPGLHDIIAKLDMEAIKEAGVLLGLRGENRTASKLGDNWAECH